MSSNMTDKNCPICRADSIKKNGAALGFHDSPFVCGACGAALSSSPTFKILLVLPLLVAVCVAIYFSKVLMEIAGMEGKAQLALGLLVAFVGANLVGRALKKSFTYRAWKGRENA